MSDKLKKENALIKLKLIHVVLAISSVLIGFGIKYFSTTTSPVVKDKTDSKTPSQVTNNHYYGDGNISHADGNAQVSITDNRITNNSNDGLRSKGVTKIDNETPPKTRKTSLPNSTTKKRITKTYFNRKFSGDVAIVNLNNKNGSSEELKTLLSNNNYITSNSFFRFNFLQDYKNDIWKQGIEIFESFEIQNNINCVCLIKEQLKYEERERSGNKFTVLEGSIDLEIINLLTGESSSIFVPAGISGSHNEDVYETMQAKFIQELSLQNQLSKFESCKR